MATFIFSQDATPGEIADVMRILAEGQQPGAALLQSAIQSAMCPACSVRACLLSQWPAHYSHADSVTLRLSGPFGDFAETGTERHVREYRSLLCMAGVGQEDTCQNV